jgi:hypothetical protein
VLRYYDPWFVLHPEEKKRKKRDFTVLPGSQVLSFSREIETFIFLSPLGTSVCSDCGGLPHGFYFYYSLPSCSRDSQSSLLA